MTLELPKKTALGAAIVLAVQGCAIFVSDRDDYPHHREHERHEHSSLETSQSAEGAAGKEMAGNQNSQVTEHLKG